MIEEEGIYEPIGESSQMDDELQRKRLESIASENVVYEKRRLAFYFSTHKSYGETTEQIRQRIVTSEPYVELCKLLKVETLPEEMLDAALEQAEDADETARRNAEEI